MTMGVMVLARTGVNHIRLGHLVSHAVASEPVVDSPACIVDFRSLAALRPPGITLGDIAVNMAEGVGKSRCQKVGKTSTFLVCNPGERRLLAGFARSIFIVGLRCSRRSQGLVFLCLVELNTPHI